MTKDQNAEPEKVYVVVRETVTQSWLRDAGTFATFAALIGLGVFLDSTAMQWAGFLIAVVTVVARTGTAHRNLFRGTRSEVIQHLQKAEL